MQSDPEKFKQLLIQGLKEFDTCSMPVEALDLCQTRASSDCFRVLQSEMENLRLEHMILSSHIVVGWLSHLEGISAAWWEEEVVENQGSWLPVFLQLRFLGQ